MKKISVKIILMNLSIFVLVFGAFFLISINNLSSVITKEAKHSLTEQVNGWAKEFDTMFSISATYVLPFRSYLEDNLTLEILKNNELSSAVFEIPTGSAISTVNDANLVDLYCWLAPEVVDDIFGSSVENYELNRSARAVSPGPYTRSDIKGDAWQWFIGTEKNGINITKPYTWEGIDEQIISYTEELVVDGKFVGVVGTDFKVGNFQKRLLEKRILETGYFALADQNLDFIFHPEHPGESISSVYSTFNEGDFKLITESESDSGVITLKTGRGVKLIAYKRFLTAGIC